MKNYKLKLIVAIVVILPLLALNNFALASEVTGTLSTGVDTGVNGTVIAPPTASPVAGTYNLAQSITLSASGSTSVHYTVDGTVPTCSTGATYTGAISVVSSQTIEAISCYPNSQASSVASFAYVINYPAPTASPVAGTYTSAQSVVLTASGSANINYTTDGSNPNCLTGATYSSAISISSSETINAIACYPNSQASSVASFAYVINISSGGGGTNGGSNNNITSGGGGGGATPITQSTTYKPGDINHDGSVDDLDFSIMMAQWGQTGTNLSADLNHDGVVDDLDFSILMANWNS